MSSQYELATTGTLSNVSTRKLYPDDPFQFSLKLGRMKSAYAEIKQEPEFTNLAWQKDSPTPFRGTLDYIFYSAKVEKSKGRTPVLTCVGVIDLPCEQVGRLQSLPSETEYSDHLMIGAEFELN